MHSIPESFLLCRVDGRRCGIPLSHVIETLRPLPIQPMADTPAFVLGLSVIRGAPIPVLDAASLLGGEGPSPSSTPTRFVVLRVSERRVAMAVGAVLGVQTLDRSSLSALPPLLRNAGREMVSALGSSDGELLVILESVRLVPDPVWRRLAAGVPA